MFWIGLVLIVAGIAFLGYHIVTAPEGYEDENGFHYGKPNEHDKDFF